MNPQFLRGTRLACLDRLLLFPMMLEQSGEHLVEGCRLLAEAREQVEREEIREWGTRHSRNQKEKKGPVEPEKEKEEDKLESFFYKLYEFHNPVPNAPAFVPAEEVLYCIVFAARTEP